MVFVFKESSFSRELRLRLYLIFVCVIKRTAFKTSQNRQKLDLHFSVNNTKIDRVTETLFLGVIIDECLTWKPHILNLTRKVSKSLGIIYKSSFCLNKNSLCTLYYSLVYPYLYYCACVWGLTYHSNLKRLVTLQKRAVRTISRSAFDAHTNPIFKSLKLLKFENIVSLQVAKIMYLYKNGQLPESFKNMFFTGQEIHNYNTRNRSFFRLPSCRRNVRKFSLRFQGLKIFNSINDKIKNSLSLREFTSKLKSTFLD